MAESATGEIHEREAGHGGRVYSTAVPGALALLGVAVAANGIKLGLGSDGAPGAGLWPFVIGVVWAVAAVTVAFGAWVRRVPLGALDGLQVPLTGLALTCLFVVLFSYVGFVVAVVVTLLLWFRLLTDLGWRRVATGVVSITALLYLLFVVVVGTALPASLVGLG